ncbi:MAG: PLP-dependent aminotransferase family protein, partial [Pikeienuella sp.]
VAFSIDRSATSPVFEQICTAIRGQIGSGILAAGAKLPPTRVLATELGVSRSTIVTAYEQLVAEGYLQSKQGSGFSVSLMGDVELKAPEKPAPTHDKSGVQDETPLMPFQGGLPDMRIFPYQQWAKIVSRVCRTNPRAMLGGSGDLGNFELRRAVASHVSEWRGIEASPQQIIITAGATDAMEFCLRTLATSGDRLALENPGYPPVRKFAATLGLLPTFMAIDESGAVPPENRSLDEASPKLAVLTPSHQYPLGGAMAPSRRMEFIQWAERHDGWIIEDDYDSEFRYAGRPIPAMAGFDRLNRTIYIGSFSKIFSNTLRLGYLILPLPLVETFRRSMAGLGVRASLMPQQALAEFILNGEFYRHIRRVRRVYGERRRYLLDRLAGEFSDFGQVTDHQSGMQVVFHLKDGLNDVAISQAAKAQGVTTLPLSTFCVDQGAYNGLVLGFCGFDELELSGGLKALKQVLSAHH